MFNTTVKYYNVTALSQGKERKREKGKGKKQWTVSSFFLSYCTFPGIMYCLPWEHIRAAST